MDLDAAQGTNEELKAEMEKHKREAEEFMESIEQELGEVAVSDEPKEERLKKKNAELSEKLTEQMQMHENAIREITRLKITLVDQVRRVTTAYDPCMQLGKFDIHR